MNESNERRILWALMSTLPPCTYCTRVATKANRRGAERFCDEHGSTEFQSALSSGANTTPAPDYPRAPALREAAALFNEPLASLAPSPLEKAARAVVEAHRVVLRNAPTVVTMAESLGPIGRAIKALEQTLGVL